MVVWLNASPTKSAETMKKQTVRLMPERIQNQVFHPLSDKMSHQAKQGMRLFLLRTETFHVQAQLWVQLHDLTWAADFPLRKQKP